MIKSLLRSLIDNTVKQRSAGAYYVYVFARRIISAFENHDVDMATNGESWLVGALAKGQPITALDVGANQGDWAEVVLKYSPHSRLLCFEPVPATYNTLKRAIDGQNVSLFNMALSSQPGTIKMHAVADNPYIASVYAGDLYQPELSRQSINVLAVTGDKILEEQCLEHVDIIKIDAEGHDYDVLLGFKGSVESDAIDIIQFEYNIFTLEARRSLNDFFEFLTPKYLVCRLLPNGLEACGYHPILDNFGQSNWVAVRADAIDRELVHRLAIRRAQGLPGQALQKILEVTPSLARII